MSKMEQLEGYSLMKCQDYLIDSKYKIQQVIQWNYIVIYKKI